MKRSKLFLAAGTFLLAITALLSTKANKRFTGITTAFFGGSTYFVTNLGSLNLTVTHSAANYYPVYLTMRTGTASIIAVQLTTSGGTGLYREN
jgi:hypothetical protein